MIKYNDYEYCELVKRYPVIRIDGAEEHKKRRPYSRADGVELVSLYELGVIRKNEINDLIREMTKTGMHFFDIMADLRWYKRQEEKQKYL